MLRHWQIWLFADNNAAWLDPHIPALIEWIRRGRSQAGYEPAPEKMTIIGSQS